MKHTALQKRRRITLFKAFVKANPPKMPEKFTHKEYKRVVSYAKIAFVTGYNTGENDVCRGRETDAAPQVSTASPGAGAGRDVGPLPAAAAPHHPAYEKYWK